jgi:hypothetical protein
LHQEPVRRGYDEERGEQAAFRGAPAGERRTLGAQMLDVVGELRVQECARIGAGDRK